jgi:hypothetical protein
MLLVEIGLSALEDTPEAAGHDVETEPLCCEVLTRPGWSSSVVLTSSAPLAAAAALWSTVVLSGPHLTEIILLFKIKTIEMFNNNPNRSKYCCLATKMRAKSYVTVMTRPPVRKISSSFILPQPQNFMRFY